jgi:hypothetical protein
MFSSEARYKVAEAWARGQGYSQSNVSTNGREVYSYGHVVGLTTPDGHKIAFDCHYSVTTAKHCSAFKGYAHHVVNSCPSCDRQPLDDVRAAVAEVL